MARSNSPAKPLHSVLAGAIAGGIEAIITYPTDYVKTQLQLQTKAASSTSFKGPVDCVIKTVREKGLRALYRGVSVQITGTAAKAGVRFLAFEEYKRILSGHGASATASIAVSGLLAGITEAILVVTPSETIKTKMIHDQNRKGGPRYSGLVSGVRTIVREEGLAGIYRGLTAVILRQGANQTVRLTSYGIMREKLAHRFPVDPKTGKVVPPVWASFGMGMIAGIITVYTTMPLDVVKTKMQSLDAKKNYRNSLDCLLKTTKNDGVLSLWNGSTPRLGRLMFSGAIVFSIYEQVMKGLEGLDIQ